MANDEMVITLQKRETIGKGLGQMRRDGFVPAVIHNHGKDSILVMADTRDMIKTYKSAGKHHPLNLQVGDQKFLALIKDVHYEPRRREMQHLVFQAISQTEKVDAEVPIHLEGEAPAVRLNYLVLHQLDHINVKALPRDLPEEFVVDVSSLADIGDKIVVGDLRVPSGVTIETDLEHPIASVVETRATAAEEAIEEAETEGEEGEAAEGEAESKTEEASE